MRRWLLLLSLIAAPLAAQQLPMAPDLPDTIVREYHVRVGVLGGPQFDQPFRVDLSDNVQVVYYLNDSAAIGIWNHHGELVAAMGHNVGDSTALDAADSLPGDSVGVFPPGPPPEPITDVGRVAIYDVVTRRQPQTGHVIMIVGLMIRSVIPIGAPDTSVRQPHTRPS